MEISVTELLEGWHRLFTGIEEMTSNASPQPKTALDELCSVDADFPQNGQQQSGQEHLGSKTVEEDNSEIGKYHSVSINMNTYRWSQGYL